MIFREGSEISFAGFFNEVVGGAHDGFLVFDDDEGVALVAKSVHDTDEPVDVAGVETDGRFVEDEKGAGEGGAETGGEVDALDLAPGERAGGAVEREISKADLVETTYDALEAYVPNCREKIDFAEAATPRTFQHYTWHEMGASFGTKFEGLTVSRGLPEQIEGLYHAGSVGIIMSGWLGTINYGVIVANDVDGLLLKRGTQAETSASPES